MITLGDCIGMCGLTEEEVLAVAEHEHLPDVAATALAQYLLSREHGSEQIRDMIVDDIRETQWNGDRIDPSYLQRRVQRGAYRALPSRRVYIPKPDGQQRPLAVAALEDK